MCTSNGGSGGSWNSGQFFRGIISTGTSCVQTLACLKLVIVSISHVTQGLVFFVSFNFIDFDACGDFKFDIALANNSVEKNKQTSFGQFKWESHRNLIWMKRSPGENCKQIWLCSSDTPTNVYSLKKYCCSSVHWARGLLGVPSSKIIKETVVVVRHMAPCLPSLDNVLTVSVKIWV